MSYWEFSGEKGSEGDNFKSGFSYNTDYEQDYGRGNDGKNGHKLMYTKTQLAQMEKESKEKADPLAGIPTFHEFTQATTFHGVGYIFEGAFRIRKFMWLLCVVGAIAVFIMQVGQRTFDFFQYGTIVDVQLVYTDEIPFPAVTMCNQNNFRTSVSVDNGLYYFVDEMYSVQNVSTIDLSKYSIDHIDTLTFLETAAHQLTDFIDSCTYKGEPCNLTQDIITTRSDLGVCYTFNSGKIVDPLKITESGTNFGLSLILNVEQYEYMRGPQNDAGIKIHLHDQNEFPLMKDMGFAVAPGTHTLVGVERSVITSMEPPYGECNATNPTAMSNCQIDCRTRMIVQACGCRDIYMTNLTDAPADLCSMKSQFICIRQQTVEIMKRQSECDCKVKCERVEYKPSLSYAQLSKFNIDRMVLNDPVRRAMVNNKFLRARELSQRVILDVAEEDIRKLNDIRSKLNIFWEDMKVVGPALQSDDSFAALYKILPIISVGDILWRAEVVAAGDRTKQLVLAYVPILQAEMMYIDKWLPAAMFNLLEVSTTPGETPGIATKLGTCLAMSAFTFPLPEYHGEVKDYFRTNGRKKRSHVDIHPGIQNFYAIDEVEYEKVKTLADCDDYLSLKQDMAYALVDQRQNLEADLEHLQGIQTMFNDFFALAYRNTSKLPTAMPQYQLCSDLLGSLTTTLWTEIDLLTDAFEAFVAVNSTADVMPAMMGMLGLASTTSLVENAAYTLKGKLYLNCYWVFIDLLNSDDKALGSDYRLFNIYYTDLNNAYLSYPTIRVSFTNLGSYGQEIYDLMNDVIVPSLIVIDDYIAERVTKMDMAQVFDSLTLRKALLELEALGDDFISIAREFDQRMKSVLHSIKNGYKFLMNSTLPIIDNELLWNLALIQHGLQSGLPQHQPLIQEFHTNPNWGQVYENYIERILFDYTASVESLKLRLPAEIDELIKSVNVMMEELVKYIEDNDMNQAFFMENFVQVDVFFKGMVYETITVQAAFGFLSLLGEIGGFMGLLLGASTLTICETIDFLVLMIYKKVKQRTLVNPGKDDTQILIA